MNHSEIDCIVQARMGSSRLYGKVMAKADGEHVVFDYLINQLKHSKFIEKIIIATTTNKEDDLIVEFAKKTGISKPKVAVLSGTEDPIESMPSSMDAKEIMMRAKQENIDAYVHGPLAFDNAISEEAAKIKDINNEVAGKADVLLVPNLETGNSLSKIMVYFMNACAAGFVVGGKVPVVVTSRADNAESRLASIAAAIIAA